MSIPCLGEQPVVQNDLLTITNCNEVLTSSSLTVNFTVDGSVASDARVDLRVSYDGGVTFVDVASSVLASSGTISNDVTPILQNGQIFTACLVLSNIPLDFVNPIAEFCCEYTANTPVVSTEVLAVKDFCLKQPTAESRAYFGCLGENYGDYVVPTVPSNIDFTTSSESAAQAFIDTMQPGQVLRIQNANGWSLDCNSTSGSIGNYKHIIGDSDCFGSGTQTSNGMRINHDGDYFMFSQMEINVAGSFSSRIWIGRGSHNVWYDIKTTNAGLMSYGSSAGGPAGSYGNPETVGNRIVRVHSTGPGHGESNAWISTLSNYSNPTGATSQDTLIAGCYVQDYGAIGTAGSGKAWTDVSWFWSEEFHSGNGPTPGPGPKIYAEFVGNHFVDCLDETLTLKNDANWVYENLFESDNVGHISMRSGSGSDIHGNFIFTNAGAGIRNASGGEHDGYLNVVYSGSNTGLGISNAASKDENGGAWRFPRRGQQHLNRFKHNVFWGPGSSAGYLNYLAEKDYEAGYPTEDNEFDSNIYIGPQADIDFVNGNSSTAIAALGVEGTQAGFDARNPGSQPDDQFWATPVAGDSCYTLPETIECPREIPSRRTWIDGRPIVAKIRPEFIGPGGLFIDTSL